MKQSSRPVLCLRWHVSRIYEDVRFLAEANPTVHVTIHAALQPMLDRLENVELEWFRHATREERSWWSREDSIEGWVRESSLLDSLENRNALDLELLPFETGQRAVAEEMVLLQTLSEGNRWRMAVEAYAGGSNDLPELTELARSQDSRWLDISRTARRSTKARYLRALREAAGNDRGGPYASKR